MIAQSTTLTLTHNFDNDNHNDNVPKNVTAVGFKAVAEAAIWPPSFRMAMKVSPDV